MYDIAQGSQLAQAQLQGQVYANSANPPSQPPVGQVLVSKLEQIQAALGQLRSSQKNLLARLHGERPEKECVPVQGGLGGSGVLGEIDQRIESIGRVIKEVIDNQSTLDRLA